MGEEKKQVDPESQILEVDNMARPQSTTTEKRPELGATTSTSNSNSDVEDDRKNLGHNGTWIHPRQNLYRLIHVFYGFIVLGMTDSSLGVLLPELERHYDINYFIASIAFVAPFCGYLIAALSSDWMHRKLGRWGVAILGPSLQMVCYIICIFAPPFPVYVIAYGITGLGGGTIDAAWNTWVGGLENSNFYMGLLHGFYGAGGIICPSVFTAMIEGGVAWNICYSVFIGMAGLNIILSVICWWGDKPKLYIDQMDMERDDEGQGASITVALKTLIAWLSAFIMFLYMGAEVGLGGWIKTFMIEVRDGGFVEMGYVTTGFWTGLTAGRVVLGTVTDFIHHEEISLIVYMALSVAFMLVFWLVNHLVVSAVAVALVGFFMGPVFPIIILVAMKKLPKWLHVSCIGFATSVGGIGGAVLPFVNGIISQHSGPEVLGPFAFSLLTAMLIAWVVYIKFF